MIMAVVDMLQFVGDHENPRTHRCGSKPMTQWLDDMEKDLGHTPTFMQVYIRTHYVEKLDGSVDGGWVNDYSEQFVDKYNGSRNTRKPGTGSIPGIYKNNTYSGRSRVSEDREKLMEEVRELKTTNEELMGKFNTLQDQMSSVHEYLHRLRQERGEE